jgi:polyisoprenoid-binding protein YceI
MKTSISRSVSIQRPQQAALVNSTRLLALAAALMTSTLTAFSAHATQLHVDGGATKFLAVGRPSLLKIHGEGKGPIGDLTLEKNLASGQLEIDISSFTTGIEMRDHHMKEKYLEVGKFPKATLSLKSVAIPEAKDLPKDFPFEAELTLHGVPQPVKGTAHLAKAGDGYDFNAHFPVKITDHKIDIPSYGGIKVADSVEVEVNSKATPVAGSASDANPKGANPDGAKPEATKKKK